MSKKSRTILTYNPFLYKANSIIVQEIAKEAAEHKPNRFFCVLRFGQHKASIITIDNASPCCPLFTDDAGSLRNPGKYACPYTR